MPGLLIYFFKVSLGLSVLYLFYQLLLRRITFYQHNRVYFLLYSALCFIIPFINISELFSTQKATVSPWINELPAITEWTDNGTTSSFTSYGKWLIIIFCVGAMILMIRLIIQWLSFRRIRSQARLIADHKVQVYQVDKPIIPFSFGQSIYLNQQLHDVDELKEIVRHEFVHVRQLHTIDIIWSEILCMVNWYNPFVWMIRKAMRQNLEFIADNKVVASGVDKKQYQYLLLKVIGNNHYSITNHFNFSSLKTRIAMMNKIKTHRVQLLRLLLLLPAFAILLLAFRQKLQAQETNPPTIKVDQQPTAVIMQDTNVLVNDKGYQLSVSAKDANTTVIVRDRNGKLVKTIAMSEWKSNKSHYEDLYGKLPPPPPVVPRPPKPASGKVPPPPPPPSAPGLTEVKIASSELREVTIAPATPAAPTTPLEELRISVKPAPPAPPVLQLKEVEAPVTAIDLAVPTVPAPPAKPNLPENVQGIHFNNNKGEVILKDGTKENYDFDVPAQKAAYEKKYGKRPFPPPVEKRSVRVD